MRVCGCIYRKSISNTHSKAKKWLSLNKVIGFRCICAKTGFLNIGDLSWYQEEMINSKSLKSINDNAYKVGVPDEYDISATFNVFLSLFV